MLRVFLRCFTANHKMAHDREIRWTSLDPLDYSSQEQTRQTMYATQSAGCRFLVFNLLSAPSFLFPSCQETGEHVPGLTVLDVMRTT